MESRSAERMTFLQIQLAELEEALQGLGARLLNHEHLQEAKNLNPLGRLTLR